jgi:hypothetical protein
MKDALFTGEYKKLYSFRKTNKSLNLSVFGRKAYCFDCTFKECLWKQEPVVIVYYNGTVNAYVDVLTARQGPGVLTGL